MTWAVHSIAAIIVRVCFVCVYCSPYRRSSLWQSQSFGFLLLIDFKHKLDFKYKIHSCISNKTHKTLLLFQFVQLLNFANHNSIMLFSIFFGCLAADFSIIFYRRKKMGHCSNSMKSSWMWAVNLCKRSTRWKMSPCLHQAMKHGMIPLFKILSGTCKIEQRPA